MFGLVLLMIGVVALALAILWRAGRAGFLKQFRIYAPGAFLGGCFAIAACAFAAESDLFTRYSGRYLGWLESVCINSGLTWAPVALERYFGFVFEVAIVYSGMIVGMLCFRNPPSRNI